MSQDLSNGPEQAPSFHVIDDSFVLRTSEAASLLSVDVNTLRSWERRFPELDLSIRTPGKHRRYPQEKVSKLAGLLAGGLSISSAISALNAEGPGLDQLTDMLDSFNSKSADGLVDSYLDIHSPENTVSNLLLPASRVMRERRGVQSAEWDITARWGQGWLQRLANLSSPPARESSIWVGNAIKYYGHADALEVSAFSLLCMRAGFRVLELSVETGGGFKRAERLLPPGRVVVAGNEARPEKINHWAHEVREATDRQVSHVFRTAHDVGKAEPDRLPDLPDLAAEALKADILASA